MRKAGYRIHKAWFIDKCIREENDFTFSKTDLYEEPMLVGEEPIPFSGYFSMTPCHSKPVTLKHKI